MKEILIWMVLLHGSAAWDGIETNRTMAITAPTSANLVEKNPVYRPFAGKHVMHVAIQVDAIAATALLFYAKARGPKTKWLARAFAGYVVGIHVKGVRSHLVHRSGWRDYVARRERFLMEHGHLHEPVPVTMLFSETPNHLRIEEGR